MSGKASTKLTLSSRKRAIKRERTMNEKGSSDLLESACQALAMVGERNSLADG